MANFILRQRAPCDECLYPCKSPAARLSKPNGVPAMLITSLPFPTDDHDTLLDHLEREVLTGQQAPIHDHDIRLFDWLSQPFGKSLWVERSGGSLGFSGSLQTTFPEARFIDVGRDGRDTRDIHAAPCRVARLLRADVACATSRRKPVHVSRS
jgi:hypothetical protein